MDEKWYATNAGIPTTKPNWQIAPLRYIINKLEMKKKMNKESKTKMLECYTAWLLEKEMFPEGWNISRIVHVYMGRKLKTISEEKTVKKRFCMNPDLWCCMCPDFEDCELL